MCFIINRLLESSSKAKLLSTKFINDFFTISIIGRNIALATILDDVAPFNVTALQNNIFMRKMFPKFAGRSMSNSVRVRFMFLELLLGIFA
jgi:uncharacterized protein YpbB